VSDIERGWVWAPKEQQRQLSALQQRGSKKEVSSSLYLPWDSLNWYLLMPSVFGACQDAQVLWVHTVQAMLHWLSSPQLSCCCFGWEQRIELPDSNVTCMPQISFRFSGFLYSFIFILKDEVKEVTFRVTRMRCWRISSIVRFHPLL
jgi:hypothetical protein